MRHKLLALFLSSCLFLSTEVRAQAAGGGAGGADPLLADTMANVWIVVGMMGGGAILGLSTLSFVEEPSENLDHIVTGGAIGIIIGVGIVGFLQATKSQELYEQSVGGPGAGQASLYRSPENSNENSRWRYQFKARDFNPSPISTSSSLLQASQGAVSKDAVLIPLNFTF